MRLNAQARGFTLVELLVVVGILALLLALILPSIQRVRELANLFVCKNHLRVIGQAVIAFTSNNQGALPSGGGDQFATNGMPMPRSFSAAGIPLTRQNQDWGWAYQILPYIENDNLWRTQSSQMPAISASAFYDPAGDEVVSKSAIELYFCPTRRSSQSITTSAYGERSSIDYAGNAGPWFDVVNSSGIRTGIHPGPLADVNGLTVPFLRFTGTGVVVKSRRHVTVSQTSSTINPLRLTDIVDGLSTTLLIAEKRVNSDRLSHQINGIPQPGDQFGYASGFGPDTVRMAEWSPEPDAPRGVVYGVGTNSLDSTHQISIPDGFGSSHLAGFNALFVDGSAHHIKYSVDYQLFKSLCHRYDGRAISLSSIED